jgi:hypothetical protein
LKWVRLNFQMRALILQRMTHSTVKVQCILSLYHGSKLTIQLPGPEESSQVLLKQWFGPDAKSEWFPYPDKAVRS